MDELMLDGNAVAGLLRELFAVEMTTATGTCGRCGAAGPTPHTSLELWDFSIVGELDEPRGWTWGEFRRAGELGGLRADVPEPPVSASMQARSVATSRRPSAGLSSAARSTH